MKKKLLMSCVIGALLVAAGLVYYIAQPSSDRPPEVITMNLTQVPVTFPHSAHGSRLECVTCHHLANAGEDFQKCSSAGCHDVLGSNANLDAHSYYRIAHERDTGEYYSCIKCHAEAAGRRPELREPLTGCTGSLCHPM